MSNDSFAVTAISNAAAVFFVTIVTEYGSAGTVLFKAIFTVITFTATIYQATDTGEVADLEFFYMITHCRHTAHYLMTGHHRKYGHAPFIAGKVKITVTDAAIQYFHGHIMRLRVSAVKRPWFKRSSSIMCGVGFGSWHRELI